MKNKLPLIVFASLLCQGCARSQKEVDNDLFTRAMSAKIREEETLLDKKIIESRRDVLEELIALMIKHRSDGFPMKELDIDKEIDKTALPLSVKYQAILLFNLYAAGLSEEKFLNKLERSQLLLKAIKNRKNPDE